MINAFWQTPAGPGLSPSNLPKFELVQVDAGRILADPPLCGP